MNLLNQYGQADVAIEVPLIGESNMIFLFVVISWRGPEAISKLASHNKMHTLRVT